MLQYNSLVDEAFLNPQYVFNGEVSGKNLNLITAEAGERPRGVWFKLFFNPDTRRVYYKVYGSPYAIAAAEWLAAALAEGRLSLGTNFDAETLRVILDMPYPYLHILITLQDAWLELGKLATELNNLPKAT